MAAPPLALLAACGLAVLLAGASAASAPAAPQGRHLSALQTAYSVSKASDGGEPQQRGCRSEEEEAELRRSLLLRVRHLERASLAQRKRLGALSAELTGEPGAAAAPPAPGAADLAARVGALERGLADRTMVAEELLKATRAATERTAAELEGAGGSCAGRCTCGGSA